MTIHVTPIPSTISFVAPSFTLGGANAAGSAKTAVASDSTISSVFNADVDLGSNLLVGNAGSTGIGISAAGVVSLAAQPSCLYVLASADENVTGAGNNYAIGTNTALTQIFDQNSDMTTAGIFTAPITGRYLVLAACGLNQLLSSTTVGNIVIDASNRKFYLVFNGATSRSANGTLVPTAPAIIDLDINDTFTVTIQVSNAPGDSVDLAGSLTYPRTYISAQLIA